MEEERITSSVHMIRQEGFACIRLDDACREGSPWIAWRHLPVKAMGDWFVQCDRLALFASHEPGFNEAVQANSPS